MWSKILGHERQIDQLRRALASGGLPNAYIFSGPSGIGKRLTADALAAAIVCEKATERDHEACGNCPACRKVASGNHPDAFVLEPETSERGAKRSIRIGQVRELAGKLMYAPLEARAKSVIIDGAEHLMPQAANSLLKTLEEPPEATHFILITPLPHTLLATIRSRCQKLAFSSLGDERIAGHLARTLSMDRAEAARIARMSGGSMGLALALDPEFVAEVMGRFLPLTRRASTADVMEAAQAFKSAPAERIPLIFDILASWYRDVLRIKTTGSADGAIHREARDAARGLGHFRITGALAKINETRLTADTAVNKQLMFEDLLFTLTG